MANKIKVSAPRSNPHICYIPEEYRDKINRVRKYTGKSLYMVLAESVGMDLSTVENIKLCKERLRKRGFRNIGEWACTLLDKLDNMADLDLLAIDLRTVTITKEDKKK